MTDARQRAPACARNSDPILAVLKRVLPAKAKVLEIASGSGEHAIYFAAAMPGLDWLTSDPEPAARASIAAWIESEGAKNVRAPLNIDVRRQSWGVEGDAPFDAILSCNMIHISPWDSALGLFTGAQRLLSPGGQLILYGPFKRDDKHTAESNEAFDASLKSRDPNWGVRDLAEVEREAAARGLTLREIVAMPANNLTVIFAKS